MLHLEWKRSGKINSFLGVHEAESLTQTGWLSTQPGMLEECGHSDKSNENSVDQKDAS